MNTSDFVNELYREHDWRFNEVRKLKNMIANEKQEAERSDLRKSLVLVLYAHFEGFCVFALQHYLTAVNQAKLDCRTAVSSILAGAWEKVFNAMQVGDAKCRVFQKPLPEDSKLHRHWRRRHFVEELDRFFGMPVMLDDDIIDSESNLKPEVLQRNLFVLGLDHTFVEPHAKTIRDLLGRRNRIAHGTDRRGVHESEYNDYETAVFEVCYQLIYFLEESHRESRFEKNQPGYIL